MQITPGTVIGGKIVVDGTQFVEGAVVTVLSPEPRQSFVLSPEDDAELLAAVGEIQRGEFISANELLNGLDSFR
ncbi:MAG: hypothetical protein RLZZ618_3962 [Pseudomonadota bacterium]|jgi:redox-sensitive bicupin YhaK (pirin superfamily)